MSDNDPIFDKIIAEYLELTQSGNLPDRQQFLDQHPDLADDLKSFFANHDQMKNAAGAGSNAPTIPPSNQSPAIEDATLPPSGRATEDATIPPSGSETIGVPEVGTKVRYFGDYELLREIARGGMGVVYKARQINRDPLAFKAILSLPQPTAFNALLRGFDGECPCCRRKFGQK